MSFGQQKTQHEEFLDKKKEEFLRKKQQISVTASPITVAPVVAGFVNDGSFLARVQAMQKQMSSSGASLSSSKPPSGASSSIEKSSGSSSSLNSLEKLPQKISIKLEEPSNSSINVLTTVKKPAVFQDEDEVTDANPYEIAKGLAERVACEGLKAEAEARVKFQNDSRYRFLFESGSPIAAFYKSCIQQMKSGNVGPDAGEKPRKRRWDSDGEQSQSSTTSSSLESAAPGPEGDAVLDFEKTMALVRAKAEAAKSGVPIVAGPTQEDIERQKAIEEQRMMQEIYRKVVEQQVKKAKESGKRRKGDKPNYGYDSDEDTEGGTWEHKKRIEEMEKTKEWAMRLTSDGRGKHHIADFLPADELEKFMEKVKAVREGRDADFSDYSKYRIQSDNLGYQLLQKAGWSEGKGLGAKEEGILQPINKGKATFDQSGVGAEKPAEVKKEDDDFDLYRKRMMLAYKFRPNPLNNPRRPYY